MKIHFSLFLIILLCARGLRASVGMDAAPFLKIDAGARAAAMGGAFTAIADDASSVFYNPAGPALMKNSELFLSHNQWIEELSTEHISYVQPVSAKLTYFAGVSALISPMMSSYDSGGNKTGSFNAMDTMYGGGFSVVANETMLGCFIKIITQKAFNEKGVAYAGDFGLLRNSGNLRVGLAAQNLGAKMKLYEEEFKLPETYRGGAAYRFMNKYWFSGEAAKIGEADVSFALGLEGELNLSQNGKGFLRFGYNNGRSENAGPGISAGLGFTGSKLGMDYAFSPFGDLGSTHRITLALKFGKNRGGLDTKNEHFEYNEKELSIVPEPPASEPAPASEDTEAVVAIPEEDPYQDLLESADNYISQKEYKNAANEYSKAQKVLTENDKRNIFTFERQGQMSLKLKNIPKAKEFYLAAIQVAKNLRVSDKTVINAYLGLAYCLEKSANVPAAIKNYEKALTLSANENTKAGIRKTIKRLKTHSN